MWLNYELHLPQPTRLCIYKRETATVPTILCSKLFAQAWFRVTDLVGSGSLLQRDLEARALGTSISPCHRRRHLERHASQ